MHGETSRRAWPEDVTDLVPGSMNLLGLNSASYKLRLTERLRVLPVSGGCIVS